jgi:hypothetical protein
VCDLKLTWTWNPAVLGDTDTYLSANWGATLTITADAQVLLSFNHFERRCHTIDRTNAGVAVGFALPAPGTTASTVYQVAHPTTGVAHSDAYYVDFTRNADGTARCVVHGMHNDRSLVPSLSPIGVGVLGAVVLLLGSAMLWMRWRRMRALS